MVELDGETVRKLLGEVIWEELKAIHELVSDTIRVSAEVKGLRTDAKIFKSDTRIMTAWLRGHDKKLEVHEKRILLLETSSVPK